MRRFLCTPYTAILFVMALVVGCEEFDAPWQAINDAFYFNSFESARDTAGWHGYGGMAVVPGGSPGGGHQSVQVSGGCLVPHATLTIAGPREDSYVLLRCWGRNLALGGALELGRAGDLSKWISIVVTDSSWRHYQSPDTLFCPAGEHLTISMSSGGIVYSSMMVDQLEIRKVR